MLKIISNLIIIVALLINCSYALNFMLYAVTTNTFDSKINILVVDSYGGSLLSNKTIDLKNGLSVLGVQSIDFTTNSITLLGVNEKDNIVNTYLIKVDVKSGDYKTSSPVSLPSNLVLNNGIPNQNYLYGYDTQLNNQVYLPSTIVDDSDLGLKIVNWDFSSNKANIFTVPGTESIDSTIQPHGVLEFNNNLIVLYHTNYQESNIASIVYLDLNGTNTNSESTTGSGSSEIILTPFETYQISLGYEMTDVETNFLYTDYTGGVYIVSNSTEVCKIDFNSLTCNVTYNINTNPGNYQSFFETQDKSQVVTVQNNNQQTQSQLTLGLWDLEFTAGLGGYVPNYWTSNNPSVYTYFAM